MTAMSFDAPTSMTAEGHLVVADAQSNRFFISVDGVASYDILRQ